MQPEGALIQVKGGKTGTKDVHDLRRVLGGEEAGGTSGPRKLTAVVDAARHYA